MSYETDYPISTKLNALKIVAADQTKPPLTRVHYAGKGMQLVINEIEDAVFELEEAHKELVDNIAHKERHSGFGRGDSMG